MDSYHQPVLVEDVISHLAVKPGGRYIDCTVGGGGHAYHILTASASDGKLLGIDRDKDAISAAKDKLKAFSHRRILVHDNFKNLKAIAYVHGWDEVDGILIDLGVSSHQIDYADRGFSYMQQGPLDMRMNRDNVISAKDIVNNSTVLELTAILKNYGEERWANLIAKRIVEARRIKEIESTKQLVSLIENTIPIRAREKGSHPAKRTFQALRIATNKELEGLDVLIGDAVELLKTGGRIAIISFHSLEDRIVKNTFKDLASSCCCPPRLPVCVCDKQAAIRIITKRPISASADELSLNPRAKSAKLRVAEKLSPGE